MDTGFSELLSEIRKARESLNERDGATKSRLDELASSVDDLFRRVSRPGAEGFGGDDASFTRKDAADYCVLKQAVKVPKDDGCSPSYEPGPSEIEEARLARKAISKLFRVGEANRLGDPLLTKSLSAFAFGNNEFILPPQLSSRVLSCLEDRTDVAGLVRNEQISAGSIKFLLDNTEFDVAGFACEPSCFANNPQPNLNGIGQVEIKVESLRYALCATSDLMQDASMNIEAWAMQKVQRAFRDRISKAILAGTGVGEPLGILNPNAGVPICDTGAGTPAGQFSWQDLILLQTTVGERWRANGSYWMNSKTLGLMLTMSDSAGRPILLATPLAGPQPGPSFSLLGRPIHIVSEMPDVAPGATPIAFGDWNEGYLLVVRAGTTFQSDPYSLSWCILLKFSTRIGGTVICPNALRLLRIR